MHRMDFVSGAALNLIVLLGMAFVLSRGFIVLRNRPRWERTLILWLGFGETALASMAVAFTIADGVIGDLRNAVIVIAALVGGPFAALVAASIAAAYGVYRGGHAGGALIGIAATAAIAIGFVRTNFARTTLNLALLGVTLAGAN